MYLNEIWNQAAEQGRHNISWRPGYTFLRRPHNAASLPIFFKKKE